MESFPLQFAVMTVKRYVCSMCWGELETVPDPSDVTAHFVLCKRCKEETRGYITKYFADHRRSESIGEERDVIRLLQTVGIFQKPPRRSVEQNLKDLGF